MEEIGFSDANPFDQLKTQLLRLGRLNLRLSRFSMRIPKDITAELGLSSIIIPPESETPHRSLRMRRSSSQLSVLREPVKDYTKKLQGIFDELYTDFEETHWVRKFEKKTFLNVVIIKQFWLDSYLCLNKMFKRLMVVLKNKDWACFDDFHKSMEGIHEKKHNSFLFIKLHSSSGSKFSMKIQKFLFYFMILSDRKKVMPFDRVLDVLLLARRTKQHRASVQTILKSIGDKNRSKNSFDEICFEDFKEIIISLYK